MVVMLPAGQEFPRLSPDPLPDLSGLRFVYKDNEMFSHGAVDLMFNFAPEVMVWRQAIRPRRADIGYKAPFFGHCPEGVIVLVRRHLQRWAVNVPTEFIDKKRFKVKRFEILPDWLRIELHGPSPCG